MKLIESDCMDFLPSVGDESIDLVVTDPPYEVTDMKDCFAHLVRVVKPTGSIYIFGDKNIIAEHWFSQLRIKNKQLLAWHYKNSPKPKGRWRMSMQGIIYGYKSEQSYFDEDAARVPYLGSTQKLHGRVRPSSGRLVKCSAYDTSKGALPRDVIECPALLGHLSRERVGHRDQKPIDLIDKIILSSSKPGDLILDCFMGSGTMVLSAIKNGREAIGVEMDPANFAMAAKRIGYFPLQSDTTPLE